MAKERASTRRLHQQQGPGSTRGSGGARRCWRSGRNVALGSATTVGAAAVACWWAAFHSSNVAIDTVAYGEVLARVRSGDCEWLSLPTLDLRALPGNESEPFRLPGFGPFEVKCPFKAIGASEAAGASTLARRWGDWEYLAKAAAQDTVTFDSAPSPSLTYWNNASLLANAVRERGTAPQRYSKITATASAFLAAVRSGPDSKWGWVNM